MSNPKVVICGAGFIGRRIAHHIQLNQAVPRQILMSSRNPRNTQADGNHSQPDTPPAIAVDVTKRETLRSAFKDASVVVSLAGIMHGRPKDFENVQWRGAENVAICAEEVGAKLVHFSAIGANPQSSIPYAMTKGLGEEAVRCYSPDAVIVRPSLVFGPEDDFFNRFARLSRILPFLPVFGGGQSRFQPVYVDDLARVVEIISRRTPEVDAFLKGKIIEAGGPGIYTYRELMQFVIDTTGRSRFIVSLPFAMGMIQGAVLERLPINLFTVTRSQVEQLKSDNIVTRREKMSSNVLSLSDVLRKYCEEPEMHSMEDVVPTYLRG